MEKQKNIPSLRFTEFIEEWQLYKLGHFFIERSEIANSENPLYSLTIENGIVPKSERYEREFLVNDIGEAYKVMYPNDYAFNPMNLRFGALARHKGNLKVGVSKYYNIFYCNIKGSQEFFEYYLTSHKMIQFYNKMATGSLLEKKRVHYLDFIEFKKPLPSLPEQQKIAAFLTSVDERIAQLTKKKALLEQYKKGAMQKIFSQKIRFKDDNGKEFPEWEEKRLGNILNERNIQVPKSDKYPLMAFVANKGVAHKGERYNREFLVNDGDNKKYKQTEYGDFIYSSNNLETGSIGLNTFGSASISPVYSIFQIEETCNPQFLGCYLVRKSFINKMTTYRQGVVYGQWRIHESDFLKIEERIPSLEEQTKIANFLSAIDKKIEGVDKQLEQTKQWKKGLLQQMFC